MQRMNLSLRGLEVFLQVAKSGSVQKAASDSGLSISTVSHHLRSIETNLGVSLLDHSRRPMVLTPAGSIFARYVEDGLRLIRRGETELTTGNLAEARDLRLGLVDDFDSDVALELAKFLAVAMPKCRFKHHTRPSHDILRLLLEQKLDAGVATQPLHDLAGLMAFPLVRDPFVVAMPANCGLSPEDCLAGRADLPFLRYSQNQIIGGLIESQLRRLRVSLPNRFELESNNSIMGMVAEDGGWTITTPASYARAKRFHGEIALHPFPGKVFSRTLSLYTTEVYAEPVLDMIDSALRRLIGQMIIGPTVSAFPWLDGMFTLMPKPELQAEA